MIQLDDIRAKTGPNPGGTLKIWLCPWEGIASIPAAQNGVVSTPITCKDGYRFVEFEFQPGSCRPKANSTGSEGGQFFRQEIELSIAGDDPELLTTFQNMLGGLFIAIVGMPAGNKLFGSLLCPLSCSELGWQPGGDVGDANATTIKFEARGKLPPAYTATIPTEAYTPPPVRETAWRVKESSAYCVTELA